MREANNLLGSGAEHYYYWDDGDGDDDEERGKASHPFCPFVSYVTNSIYHDGMARSTLNFDTVSLMSDDFPLSTPR
jgi:hypothetical protein